MVAAGAEVSGTLFYDDVFVTSVFPDIKQVIAAAYLSVVDNATGDPTFIAIAPQSASGG